MAALMMGRTDGEKTCTCNDTEGCGTTREIG